MSTAELSAQVAEEIPWLENGDRLDRREFERRYRAMPDLKKAELVEGTVYVMASPLSADLHGAPHSEIITWLGYYKAKTPGLRVCDNASIRLDETNEPQPDALLYIRPEHGGRVRLDPRGFIEQAPELVAEVSNTSASLDLHGKLRIYESHGVREYIVWRARDRAIDWFVSREGRFERLGLGADGVCRSETFPGLWLDAGAMIEEDTGRVLEVLSQGLASPEHAQFVQRLRDAAQAPQPRQPPNPARETPR